jgi:hypothetical protein
MSDLVQFKPDERPPFADEFAVSSDGKTTGREKLFAYANIPQKAARRTGHHAGAPHGGDREQTFQPCLLFTAHAVGEREP